MFYILERQDQLDKLDPFNDCFVEFIQYNDNYHPKLSDLSLIYIRDLAQHKGYILCLDHNESFQLDKETVLRWLLDNTDRLFVLDKKQALYHFQHDYKLFDINFIKPIKLSVELPVVKHYYRTNYSAVNKLIPISKHYEKCELTFFNVLPIISEFRADDAVYAFNNGPLTRVFQQIESNGIKIDKQCFIDCYGEDLQHPEYSIAKGKIYSHYNLYTTTGRPSNSYNSINFAALNKTNGERLCYRPVDDVFIEFDYKAFHISILSNLIGYKWESDDIHNELGKQYFNKTELTKEEYNQSKIITFSQIYGHIRKEYNQISFFKQMQDYIDNIWNKFQQTQSISTPIRTFVPSNISDINPNKLLNYIIQSYETIINVEILLEILKYLENKQSNLVLYVYDSYLIDLSKNEQYIIEDIIYIIKQKGYNVNVKMGKDYQRLSKM
jgi:hypothetical protein